MKCTETKDFNWLNIVGVFHFWILYLFYFIKLSVSRKKKWLSLCSVPFWQTTTKNFLLNSYFVFCIFFSDYSVYKCLKNNWFISFYNNNLTGILKFSWRNRDVLYITILLSQSLFKCVILFYRDLLLNISWLIVSFIFLRHEIEHKIIFSIF